MAALENYFKPNRNVVYERYIINSCEKNTGESIDSFFTRLRKYASSCEFGLINDEAIRDRLVIGLIDKGAKRKLLREKTLTLDKWLDIACSEEITSQQLASIKSESESTKEELNGVEKGKAKDFKKQPSGKERKGKKREETPKKKKHTGHEKGKFCGKQQRHNKRKDCPVYNKKCSFCLKWHHFASVCMSRNPSSGREL